MENLTNKELKVAFLEMQEKHSSVKHKVSIKQSETSKSIVVKIYWEYIQEMGKKSDCWTLTLFKEDIDSKYSNVVVYDEYNDCMNDDLEDCTSMKSAVESVAYYMNARY